jgi:asparagine synthase (glutamine-hydrolysing)
MRTNGFALFRGPDGQARAEKAAQRVQRYSREILICAGSDIEGLGPDSEGKDVHVIVYKLGGTPNLPLVHGFIDERLEDAPVGEFALLRREDGGLVASRDVLGTRPLYTDSSGACVASDHRFFTETPKLLPNGARLEIGSMKLTTSTLSSGGEWSNIDECAEGAARILKGSVARRVKGRKKVAVSFSGGLDSSLIALLASQETQVVLCSAYTPGSRDAEQAKVGASALGLELVEVQVDGTGMDKELRSLDLPFEPSPMDKALWCIYSSTSRAAVEKGAELIMLGQLADELFGGYMKYARAAKESEEAAAAMMLADVVASGQKAFVRDEEACARFTEVRFPFADDKLASYALAIPMEYKVAGGERKVVLRKAAAMLGLPEILAAAPKKAAQYSSGVSKLVT